MKIKKDDRVKVISGKDKGKTGKVLKTYSKENTVIVEGVNKIKRHQRPTNNQKEGGIIEKDAPLKVNKVMLVCPVCDKPTRIGHKRLENNEKVRTCKKCGEIIDKV